MKRKQCPCCGLDRVGPIRIWRTHTAFVDTRLNFMVSCYRCIEENDYMRYWDWVEYYSSQYGYYERQPYEKRPTKAWYRKCEYLRALQPTPASSMAGATNEPDY